MSLIAARANAAYDRDDFETFDRLRDLDEAVKNLPTEELEAFLAKPSPHPQPAITDRATA